METAEQRVAGRRFGRVGDDDASRRRGGAVEHVDESRWERVPGHAVDRFLLRDHDGKVVARLDTAERAWQERLAGGCRSSSPLAARTRSGSTAARPALSAGSTGGTSRHSSAKDRMPRSRPPTGRCLRGRGRVSAPGAPYGRAPVEHGPAATRDKVVERLRPHVFLEEAHAWSETAPERRPAGAACAGRHGPRSRDG